jgi:DNA-binding transcriptional ArsR family regulator
MPDGPDLARIASLVGEPARANMLAALMGGGALTASELALEAGVGLPTASAHLARLMDGGLLKCTAQGRHRYFSLSSEPVAAMLESIMGVAAEAGPKRVRPGPRDAAMREARVCYDHLAGEHAVAMLDAMLSQGILTDEAGTLRPGAPAAKFFGGLGIDLAAIGNQRRAVCRACLDWSMRRSHLAGALGAAVLDQILARKWAARDKTGRVVRFAPTGKAAFQRAFLIAS